MTSIDAPVADWVTIPELHRDPFPIYERLRNEGGVHWVPGVDRYLVTSYEAVHETELDQSVFSANEEGSLQIRAMGHSMLRRDDPEHYIERRAWQPALRPGAVKRVWAKAFARNAEAHLADFIAKGPGADLIWDFAAPYAGDSLREVMGLYNATHQDLQRWSQLMIDATGNYADDPEVWAKGEQAFNEVDDALDEMLAWHATNPDDSLLSTLLRLPDYKMPLEKIRANIKMTIGGGMNEPRDALGVATWALLTHPEQRAAVAADRKLWSSVFEETIRWVAPIGMYSRQTTQDTVLTGVRLPRGARLGICLLSANRDRNIWADADAFDIGREVKPHLAFGKGVHVCLGAWVARSEVADVALPLLFDRLNGLALDPNNPAEISGWVFRGMTKLPVTWKSVTREAPVESAPDHKPRIAIVGSGPAGCFSAQALRRTFPNAELDVFDALPVPYGLVRYGVASDHQGTKSVSHQFDRLFLHDQVRFHGNTRIGTDFTLPELREAFDAVILATGLATDVPLPIPGADLPGVIGAGKITRTFNSHPTAPELEPLGSSVTIVGHGNVAMDIARLIARDAAGLEGSDIDDATHQLVTGDVRTIHLVGRSGPTTAKFDPVMVRELAQLAGVRHVVHGLEDLDAAPGKDARVDAIRSLTESDPDIERIRVEWWFNLTPTRIDAGPLGRVSGLTCSGAAGEVHIDAESVITAIGFTGDQETPVVPGAHDDGRVETGLYVAGWLRRGARGTIPDQRTDAQSLAKLIASDIASGALRTGRAGLPAFEQVVDFHQWRRIDLLERLGAAPGRERAKLHTVAAMLTAANDNTLELPELPQPAGAGDGWHQPVSVWFATESGGAELVAEELGRIIGDAATVTELESATPEDLDPARFHIIVCSTYGDGEVPRMGQSFHGALLNGETDLTGVRYAVFGMGDRSYTRTYFRGSELIDEALAACGAERIGEFGRHDASGSVDATDAALDWAGGLREQITASFAVGAS